ncbi:NYN domain-containing protein [Marimonas arenosa]|uniref:NYN domain-containing protein n=1 Tax=Marimonas arenosa TaxID=1795305 RepID=A0AAE3WBM3_9RHOB|nr:NYN domain-containing protein [Marimonas arenosa]MDQ2089430.1 NYN domain-containing protein [Marimonas arenosa]
MSSADISRPRVALLIDGENISSALAGKLIVAAGKHGELIVKRVYGGAQRIPGWDAAPGIKLVHSGSGKNSADLLLTVDAIKLAERRGFDVFALASSDGDHTHLATHLRENGFRVIGLGEDKAPLGFRKSCSVWVNVENKDVEARIYDFFQKKRGGVLIGKVSHELRDALGVTLSDLKEKSWRKYFEARPDHFAISGEGQHTSVTSR